MKDPTFRLLVHAAEIGRVLGRKGATANLIRMSSRCKIDLGDPNPMWNGRIVSVKAQSWPAGETLNSVASAFQQIMGLLWPADSTMLSMSFLIDASSVASF